MAKNPLSSLSYTNKDFNSIYVELLDLVKQLTHKWDPSISNESDPGVILLKLDAIIGDKNNYNIDKNILEAFPETVTQEVNARNVYKQLAYTMPWYKSAEVTLSMRWIGEELQDGVSVKIPRYTMVTNEDTSAIYTILEEPVFTNNSTTVKVKAQEGVIVTHTINGNSVLDLSNLDSSNRVFLNDYTVAENGIFITNENNVTAQWTKVPNLHVKPSGNKFYEFGVDSRNNYCYLEFPDDIDALIESGLTIKYLVSSGAEGNISARTLDRFYDEVSVDVAGQPVVLSSDVVELYNISESTGGADPESITDAYKSYRKTAGTFNTLVTLRDYINAIYNTGLISNGYVCDRNNDLQSSYTVIVDDSINPEYIYTKETQLFNAETFKSIQGWEVLKDAATKPELNAFDLRLYAMKSGGSTISNISQYETTFEIIPSTDSKTQEILGAIQEQQCISHDFRDILEDIPCMFQNAYPINIKIVPQRKLNSTEINEVKRNILVALVGILNSRVVEFGEEPNYDLISDAIYQSDERIKTAILDDFKYTTFAIYWDKNEARFKRIPINHYNDLDTNFIIKFKSYDELKDWGDLSNSDKSEEQRDGACFMYIGNPTESIQRLYYTEEGKVVSSSSLNGVSEMEPFDIICFDKVQECFVKYSDLYKAVQRNVLTKSILAGKTPLLESKTGFTYGAHHRYIDERQLSNITTGLTVAPFSESGSITSTTIKVQDDTYTVPVPNVEDNVSKAVSASYTLQPNETIRFLAPSFQTKRSFSNYVKFELVLNKGETTARDITSQNDLEQGQVIYISKESRAKALLYTLRQLTNLHTTITTQLNAANKLDEGKKYPSETEKAETSYTKQKIENGKVPATSVNTEKEIKWFDKSGKELTAYSYTESIEDSTIVSHTPVDTSIEPTWYDGEGRVMESNLPTLTSDGKIQNKRSACTVVYTTKLPTLTSNGKVEEQGSDAVFVSYTAIEPVMKDYYFSNITQFYEGGIVGKALKSNIEYLLKEPEDSKICSDYNDSDDETGNTASLLNNVADFAKHRDALKTFTSEGIIFEYGNANIEGENPAYCSIKVSGNTKTFKFGQFDTNMFDTLHSYLENKDVECRWELTTDSSSSLLGYYCKTISVQELGLNARAVFTINEYDCVMFAAFSTNAVVEDPIPLKYVERVYTIPADTDYKLQAGEQITFFWRTEEGDDTPYVYAHYKGISTEDEISSKKKSPIIRANFQVKGQAQSDFVNLVESGTIKPGEAYFNHISDMYGEKDLSGTKTIDIREMNQLTLDREKGFHKKLHKIYFITKKTQKTDNKEQYVMSLPLVSEDTADTLQYRYTLQNDEYFVHVAQDGSRYEFLSAGALIGIDVNRDYMLTKNPADPTKTIVQPSIDLTVDEVSINAINEGGLDAFIDLCIDIDRKYTLFCREQQIYTLVSGNKLHLTVNDEEAFKLSNPKLYTYLGIEQEPLFTRPVFGSWFDTKVVGVEVSYSDDNGEYTLPKLNIAGDADSVWTGRAYLNLTTAPNDAQTVQKQYTDYVNTQKKSAQFIAYPVINNEDESEMRVYPSSEDDSVCIETSIPIDRVGGTDTDITYVDGTGSSKATTVYVYSLNKTFDDRDYYTARSDDSIQVAMKGWGELNHNEVPIVDGKVAYTPVDTTVKPVWYNERHEEITLDSAKLNEDGTVEGADDATYVSYTAQSPYLRDIQLDSRDSYIFKVENTSKNVRFRFYIGTSPQKRLGDIQNEYRAEEPSYGYGISYFLLRSQSNVQLNFKFIDEDGNEIESSKDILIIHPVARGTLNKDLFTEEGRYSYLFEDADNTFNQYLVLHELENLDYKSKFKYTHQIQEENLIKNPLDSKEFFNTNHIYNSFTIGKAEISLSDLTGSSIMIVNNR